jgi:hypothetical protein
MLGADIQIFFALVEGVGRHMDIGFVIPQAGYAADSASSNALSENGQLQQPNQNRSFSALLKDITRNVSGEQLPPFSSADHPTESAPLTASDGSVAGAVLSSITVAAVVVVGDLPTMVSQAVGKDASVQNSSEVATENIESIPLPSQGLNTVAPHDGRIVGYESVPADSPKPGGTSSSLNPLLPPVLDHAPLNRLTTAQSGSQTSDARPIRNDRGAPADLSPAPLNQSFGSATLPSAAPPDSTASDPGLVPFMKDQGDRNLLSALPINGETQSRDRPSIEVLPTMKGQEQATKEPLLVSQSVFASVIADNNEKGQDLFEADTQGAEEGAFLDSGENSVSESVARDNQPSFFNSQFTSMRQTQPSAGGERASVVTPSTSVEEDHSATMTASASGKAQVVRLELPAHDSSPLSVRISMMDQMVHTQFTTDRNDLGALLFARHDQLQHNLAKSGLELGQFQVHIDQQGKQEALPDRQSRRNGGELEQQPASQDHRQPAQEQERHNHRPSRALSLFA